ncbi:hypothetical protein HaLaN_28477 [Haematococcus lacustris]|uniref:Uncharacterized protein n=1 Tax=Haematococcus lacustris TaxID=44745 RepID=A0A6A0AAH2_HAELA|nr:hypothetical protein HaLaN_28477 [Haematococcus lacustris]
MVASILSLPCHGLGLGLILTLSKHPITAMSCAALRIEQRSYGTSPCMVSQDEQWECTHGVRDYMSLHSRYEQWDYVVEKEAR